MGTGYMNAFLYQFRYDFSQLICQCGVLVLGLPALRSIPHLSSALPYNIHRLNPMGCSSWVGQHFAIWLLPTGKPIGDQNLGEWSSQSFSPSSSASAGFPFNGLIFSMAPAQQVDSPWLQILLKPLRPSSLEVGMTSLCC